MGRNKRNPPPNRTLAPPPPADAPVRLPVVTVEEGGDIAAIRAYCEKALVCLQRGNEPKALRLMKEALAHHGEGSPLLLRAHATVHACAADVLSDPAARARHHQATLQATHRAINLAPDSVELAHFHATLLFETASNSHDYEKSAAECKRGLNIEAPSDPASHSLLLPARNIEQIRSQLNTLMEKAHVASVSKWLKSIGEDDKLAQLCLADKTIEPDLAPVGTSEDIKTLHEYFTEKVDLLAAKILMQEKQQEQQNGFKKATKTPEERRMEIEVQVTAMRLLEQHQQHSVVGATSSPPHSPEDEGPSTSSRFHV
ncbi:uncharacterized protein LOC104581868 [Brachypodium distachyon]|uniref:DUF627 domain-containing protein n=1 Tax=Brachypodium distachyon TaxID=15368 RepID=A0A2K2DV22_BRADI|nr:uncharacterized protein LOC104581868 [Brachypodium distachyon]PNT78128.1 hypothetical protein BRADI_1g74098v3 [Brachypodium distachyon]|eukprot:XP_010229155.1 uncharacterized protein LOC104581868 [Brachypodium distachyon]